MLKKQEKQHVEIVQYVENESSYQLTRLQLIYKKLN